MVPKGTSLLPPGGALALNFVTLNYVDARAVELV